MLMGLVIGRHLLKFDDLRDAPTDRIVDLLRPCVQALADPDRGV
jgi:hypothetical protein